MTMKCEACARDIPDGSQFCNFCGAKTGADRADSVTRVQMDNSPEPAASVAPVTMGEPAERAGAKTQMEIERPAGEPREAGYGRYEILQKVGEGGMGAVYKAHDTRLGITVALKRLIVTDEAVETGVARFMREAQTIASLNHVNIIRIYDIGEDEDGHYIAMEYVDGQNLDDLIQQKKQLPVAESVEFIRPVCLGLAYAHKKGIVHRDVKPGNILINSEGVPKIVDFGLALVRTHSGITRSHVGMGTIAYTAPEQQLDARKVDHRADIFSVGATLYEMLTGAPPTSMREASLPPRLAPVVMRATELRPENRFYDMKELLDALDAAAKQPEPAPSPPEAAPVEAGLCPNCHKPTKPDAKFCELCGAGLEEACPACNAVYRMGAKFCPSCGADIAQWQKLADALARAKDCMEEHRYADAAELAEMALQVCPHHEEARQLFADAKEKRERLVQHIEKAQALLKAARFEDAEAELRGILELNPNDPKAAGMLGRLPAMIKGRDYKRALVKAGRLEKQKQYDEALHACDEALRIHEAGREAAELRERVAAESRAAKEQQIREHLALAEEAYARGAYEEALDHCDKALAVRAEHPEARTLLQRAAQLKEKQRPQILAAMLEKGVAMLKAHKSEDAFDLFRRALALFPDSAEVKGYYESARIDVLRRDMALIPAGPYVSARLASKFKGVKLGRRRVFARYKRIELPAYYIDKQLVTNDQYRKFVEDTGHAPPDNWRGGKMPSEIEDHPVVNVSFDDASAYATWAGKRLPSEEEWEKAARGRNGLLFPWGEEFIPGRCNLGYTGTTPVNRFPLGASPYGVMDLLGNVWEWCERRIRPESSTRPMRGGSWITPKANTASRQKAQPSYKAKDVGFRCAMDAGAGGGHGDGA